MKKQFSVLMSVYAKEKPEYLSDALDSVIEQTVIPCEVVLVEDGPLTSDLLDVIQMYKERINIVSVKLSKNSGLGAALNKGLEACSYELIARMDSDDLSLPTRFEKQLDVFSNSPEVSICGGWISEFSNKSDNITGYRKVPLNHQEIKDYFKRMSPMNHVTVMFRKSAVLSVGGYRPFHQFEDYWLWARMLKDGAIFKNIPDILVNVRGGAEMSGRRGGIKYIRSEFRFQKEILRLKLIDERSFVYNLFVRTIVRILPNSFRSISYKCIRKYQDFIISRKFSVS